MIAPTNMVVHECGSPRTSTPTTLILPSWYKAPNLRGTNSDIWVQALPAAKMMLCSA